MGISDLREKLTDFRGLKRLFSSDDDGAKDGLRGGGGGEGVGFTKGEGSTRPWTQFDSNGGIAGSGITQYLIRGSQIFFLLVAILINAHMTTTQKKWNVGPSALVGLTFFLAILAVLHSIVMLVLPLVHEKTGKMRDISRGLGQTRSRFLIDGTQTCLMLILAFVLTISSNTKGCKSPDKDPHADKEGYIDAIPGFCRDKRGLTAFLWFAFLAWLVSLILTLQAWRNSRSSGKIPAFKPPPDEEDKDGHSDEGDDEQRYDSLSAHAPANMAYSPRGASNSPSYGYSPGGFAAQAAGRQSTTFYEGGRPFDGATPTGYGSAPYANPYDRSPNYDDPYERIRAERGA